MSRHLTDHEKPAQEEGLKHLLRIARAETAGFWKTLWKRRSLPAPADRRIVEYVRIEKGREA